MSLRDWDDRHRAEDSERRRVTSADALPEGLTPTRLLSDAVANYATKQLNRRALDLACGTGRNALWLARNGWDVTAVDGSSAAIEILGRDAAALGVSVQTRVADLEKHEFTVAPSFWDLIVICKYYQADLYASAIRGLLPGGVLVATALLGEAVSRGHNEVGKHRYRVAPGEFGRYFEGLEILHSEEVSGVKQHSVDGHALAEIAARMPGAAVDPPVLDGQ